MKTGKEAVEQQRKKVQEMHNTLNDFNDYYESGIMNKKQFDQDAYMLLRSEEIKLGHMEIINR